MRYVISDIHGEYSLFLELMDKIGFSDGDELYCCGDIIEKGEQSVKLAKWLLGRPNVHSIRGNHEEAFLNFYYSLMRENDDYDAVLKELQGYIHGDGQLLDWDTVEAIESLPYYIEADDFICVHAGVPLGASGEIPPLDEIPVEELLYNRRFKQPDVIPRGAKCVFYGHTPTMNVFPDATIITYLRHGSDGRNIADYVKVHLDTGTFTSGLLGCFCIDTCTAHFVTKRKDLARISGKTHPIC